MNTNSNVGTNTCITRELIAVDEGLARSGVMNSLSASPEGGGGKQHAQIEWK